MADDPNPNSNRMIELEESIRRLEAKLAEVSASKEPPPPAKSAPKEEPPPAREPAAAEGEDILPKKDLELERPLAGAAVLCVVLTCALLLRRSAEASWVAPATAPLVGIGYCTLLLAVSAAIFPRMRTMAALVAHAGLVLGFLIVLETHFARGTLSLARAQGTLAGLAVAATVLGWARNSAPVAAVGIVGAAWIGAFLGPDVEKFFEVALGLAATEVVALLLAYRLKWTVLRWPLFVLAQAFGLMWAIYLRSKGADDPRLAGFAIGLPLLEAPFLVAAVYQSMRADRRLDALEASVPLLASACALGLLALAKTPADAMGASLVAVALLGFGAFRAFQVTAHTSGGAFLFAGGLLAAWYWPALHPWASLAVAGTALAIFALGRRGKVRAPCAVAHVVQGAVVARLILLGAIWSLHGGSIPVALIVGAIAIVQYLASRVFYPRRGAEQDREVIVSAVAGALGLFGALRVAFVGVLHADSGPTFQTAQSVIACVLVASALAVALWMQLADLLEVAVVALVLLGAKIVFYDTFTLPPAMAIPAVASLAGTLALASFAIQRRRKGSWD